MNSVELKIGLFTVTSFYYLFYHFDYCLRTKNNNYFKIFRFDTKNPLVGLGDFLQKAVDGFEPTIKLLQSRALPLGYTAITFLILP